MHRRPDTHGKRERRREGQENGAETPPAPVSAAAKQANEERSKQLAREWRSETRFLSNVTTKAMHPAYQKIIGMGQCAVPLMLEDLVAHGPADWFWALHVITDANPVTPEIAGNMAAMTEAWVRWGKDEGYLSGSRRRTKKSSRD